MRRQDLFGGIREATRNCIKCGSGVESSSSSSEDPPKKPRECSVDEVMNDKQWRICWDDIVLVS